MAQLTPKDILDISEPVESIYQRTVDELLINIAKHFKITGWERTRYWEIKKLSELGALTQESVNIIAKNTGMLPEEIQKAFLQVSEKACLDIDPQLREAAEKGILQDPGTSPMTSVLMRDMVQGYTQQAIDKMNMTNTTMLESTRRAYLHAVEQVVTEEQLEEAKQIVETQSFAVATGTETRTRAIRKAMDQLSDAGLTGFIDRAGRHWQPEAYAAMVVRTTSHNAAIEAIKNRQQEFGGGDIFQISSHTGARPLCAPYQGGLYSWGRGSGKVYDGDGKAYDYDSIYSTSYGEAAGIFGINCGHHPIPFISGYSFPQEGPQQTPEENAKEYEESQKQRQYERNIRAAKRELAMAEASGDRDRVMELQHKVSQEQAKMRSFIKQTGRARRYDREQIGDSGIQKYTQNAYNAFRRVSNEGTPFAKLSEPMQLRHVRSVISEMGIDYKDIKIKIERDIGALGSGFMGVTNDRGTGVNLFPDAFRSREQLVKTLGHERIHVEQIRLWGGTHDTGDDSSARERAAVFSEEYWWQEYKNRTGYGK